jgi:hypothetical protein
VDWHLKAAEANPPARSQKSSRRREEDTSWRDSSSGRSTRPPLARNDKGIPKPPSIPKPPAPLVEKSSSATRPPPTPASTRGELRYPIPHFDGEYIDLFTRREAKYVYATVEAKTLPKQGELLSESDLQRVLKKTVENITQYDKDLADFIMDRIDDASKQASECVIEMMYGTTKHCVNIHGESFNERVAIRDLKNLYTLLPTKTIKLVGNYYSVLRQRPTTGKPAYEYMPNSTYPYRVVKRDLAQLDIEVFPSRMRVESVFLNTTDPQLHPYIEW